MIIVKICGLTTLDDARCAWHSGADFLGFIMVPTSPRYVTPQEVAEIVGALKDQGCPCRCVGVFIARDGSNVSEIVRVCGLHLAQLHGQEAEVLATSLDVPVILARRVGNRVPWETLASDRAWAYLLDTRHPEKEGGTGLSWRWDLLAEGDIVGKRVIVAGGLNPGNVGDLVSRYRPWGVDAASGVELSPGRKDPDKVRRFIANVRRQEEM